MQESFFQHLPKDSLSCATYETLLDSLNKSWGAASNITVGSSLYEENQRHNQRRLNRRKRKELGVAKKLRKLDLVSALSLPVVSQRRQSRPVFHTPQKWLLIARNESLREYARRWAFERVRIHFPPTSQFGTPRCFSFDALLYVNLMRM